MENNPYRKYYANFPKGVGINCSNCVGAYDEGNKAGIREVVEWIETKGYLHPVLPNVWQAKLRDWGIKEG